ncbi:MAG: CheY-like chemotaxis protein [Glaciecola sp.]|jgi:CheY-like chemotaxis protein
MGTQASPLVFFSHDLDQDAPILEVLKAHFGKVEVISDLKRVCEALTSPSPKIFLFAGDTLAVSIAAYYKALDACNKHSTCDHKVVTLVSKNQEKLAFDAFKGGVIDEFLIFRPLHEPYRAILVIEHLLLVLGITTFSKHSDQDFLKQSSKYPSELNQLVEKGKQRKADCNAAFEKTIAELEGIVDKTIRDLEMEQSVHLDIKKVASLLSKIKTDELRPKLLQLQSKTIQLLESVLKQSAPDEVVEEQTEELAVAKDEKISTPQPPPMYNNLYNNIDKIEEVLEQAGKKKSVLLVEDDLISQQLTLKLLARYPVKVEFVNSGRRAFASLSCNKYDLVLMDINLPDTNGIYIVDQIVSKDLMNADTPIIMLTGNKNKQTIREAVDRGAQGYIVKPLFRPTLDKLLNKFGLIP